MRNKIIWWIIGIIVLLIIGFIFMGGKSGIDEEGKIPLAESEDLLSESEVDVSDIDSSTTGDLLHDAFPEDGDEVELGDMS